LQRTFYENITARFCEIDSRSVRIALQGGGGEGRSVSLLCPGLGLQTCRARNSEAKSARGVGLQLMSLLEDSIGTIRQQCAKFDSAKFDPLIKGSFRTWGLTLENNKVLQGYLAHEKSPIPLCPPQDPRRRPPAVA